MQLLAEKRFLKYTSLQRVYFFSSDLTPIVLSVAMRDHINFNYLLEANGCYLILSRKQLVVALTFFRKVIRVFVSRT